MIALLVVGLTLILFSTAGLFVGYGTGRFPARWPFYEFARDKDPKVFAIGLRTFWGALVVGSILLAISIYG